MLDLVDLALAGVARESLEHRACDTLGLAGEVIFELFLDMRQKIFFVPLFARFPLERPTFIVEAPPEWWRCRLAIVGQV